MAWELNGQLRQDPVVAQEAKEALQPVAIGHDGPGGVTPCWKAGRNPGINIGGRGLRQVLILQGGLPARGHEHSRNI